MATPLLIKPSLDEVRAQAKKINLPPDEADAFFYYYESNGWRVGKNLMKCWLSALQGWRIRWTQKQRARLSEKMRSECSVQVDRTLRDIQREGFR